MPKYANRSVERGAAILDCLGEHDGPLTLSEIANAIGINTATTFRLLKVLQDIEYVHKDERKGTYSLGYRIYRIGRHERQLESLARDAAPYIRRLAYGLGLTTVLGALMGNLVVVHEVVQPPDGMALPLRSGQALEAHCTALGKIMLAWRQSADVHEMYRQRALAARSANTITNLAELESALRLARDTGYAVECGEWASDCWSLAVPIVNTLGTANMAIAVYWPKTHSERLPAAPDLARHMTRTVRELFQYRAPKQAG